MLLGNNIYKISLQFKLKLILLLFCVLIQSLLNVITIISIAPIIDFLLAKDLDNLNQVTIFFKFIFNFFNLQFRLFESFILFGVLIFFTALSNLLLIYLNLKIRYSILMKIKSDTMKIFLNSNYLFFNKKKIGKLINTFEMETNKLITGIDQFIKIVSSSIQAFIILFVPISISLKFSIIFVLILGVFIMPVLFFKNVAYRYGLKNTETANDVSNIIYSTLSSIKLIFSYGMKENAFQKFKRSVSSHISSAIKSQFITQGVYIVFFSIAMISILIPSYIYIESNKPLSNLVIIILAFQRMFTYVASILRSRAIIINTKPAAEQINDLQKEAFSLISPNKGTKTFFNLKNEINLKGINFKYPNNSNQIISDLNLKIKKNKITAIVGKSGSGKSTLIDMLMGLLYPQKGSIEIDNINLNNFDIDSFRAKIGYIPQDPVLFNLSIKENLLWANSNAKESEIWNALEFVEMKTFIENLPEKLNTVVGDRGHSLSGGQRQRIAFARALIRNPEILILDEATSSVDLHTRQIIEKKIIDLSRKLTIVVISHSSSLNELCDEIFYVEDKKQISSN